MSMETVTSIVLKYGSPMIFRLLILLLLLSCSPLSKTWRVSNHCFILESRKVTCNSTASERDIWHAYAVWLTHRGGSPDPYPDIYQVWFEGCGGMKNSQYRHYRNLSDQHHTYYNNDPLMYRGGYCISWGYYEDPDYVERQLQRFMRTRSHDKYPPEYEYENKPVPPAAGTGPVFPYWSNGSPWPDK